MKWNLFTGTWRYTNAEVEVDVRAAVRDVLARGEGMLTGGATGVDYFAMDEALKLDPTATQILVIIPAHLESYIKDYYDNWCVEPIIKKDIDTLAALLRKIKEVRPEALIEMPYSVITQEHYNMRHDEEVARASAVYAFQVNNSSGTQDTLDKAIKAGLSVTLYKKYSITV